jgi:hypothetical protein
VDGQTKATFDINEPQVQRFGYSFDSISVFGIGPEKSITIPNPSVGTHNIALIADINNAVAESNEWNNEVSFLFTVTAPATSTFIPVITPIPTIPTVPYNPWGNEGQAFRIYKAAFDRMPDASGLSFWTNTMNSGKSLTEVANGFMSSPEFVAMYGGNPTVDTFVNKVYFNVLHRAPDAGGYSFWANTLYNGSLTQGGLLASISESQENQDAVLALVGVNNATQL